MTLLKLFLWRHFILWYRLYGCLPFYIFLLIVSMQALLLGQSLLQNPLMMVSIVWVALSVSTALSCDTLFVQEWETGALDNLLLQPNMVPLFVLSSCIGHSLILVIGFVGFTAPLMVLFNLSQIHIIILMITIILGVPSLVFIGGIISSLLFSVYQRRLLIPLLVLPLYAPIVICAAGAVLTQEVIYLYALASLLCVWAGIGTLFATIGLRQETAFQHYTQNE